MLLLLLVEGVGREAGAIERLTGLGRGSRCEEGGFGSSSSLLCMAMGRAGETRFEGLDPIVLGVLV